MPRTTKTQPDGEDELPIVPGTPAAPPEPPPELSEIEAGIWREIAAKMPAGWFTADNAPLLKELCRHIRHADELAADLEVVRDALARAVDRKTVDPVLIEQFLELQKARIAIMRAHGYQSERIGNLATKLRLTNQSRYQAQKADRDTRKQPTPGTVKPWLDWGDNARSDKGTRQ
jgi:hypothetical protein